MPLLKSSSPQRFYPPQLNPPLVRLLQQVAPWLVRWRFQVELVISTEAQVQISTLRQRPCLFVCNHPTFTDPMMLFLFSSILKQPFHYLAAYERFGGVGGWLLQQIGAYSIRRGQADRDSVAQTLKLLAQPDCKLVIFPEGGCSFQNDTVMPFRPGAVQMAMQALSKRTRQAEEEGARLASLDFYVVPISLKYRYIGNMTPIIEQTLERLERALRVKGTGDFYQRLRVVAAAVMGRFEQEYGLSGQASQDWNERIAALKSQVLAQCEQQLQLTSAPDQPTRERVYRMQHALENRYSQDSSDPGSGEAGNGDSWTDSWEVMRKSLSRLLNFDAIYDGYVGEKPTPERFLDTLTRLEREVFDIDQPASKAKRQAFLRVGRPLNLRDFLADYGQNRSETIATVTQQVQQTVQKNLDVLSEATARGISW